MLIRLNNHYYHSQIDEVFVVWLDLVCGFYPIYVRALFVCEGTCNWDKNLVGYDELMSLFSHRLGGTLLENHALGVLCGCGSRRHCLYANSGVVIGYMFSSYTCYGYTIFTVALCNYVCHAKIASTHFRDTRGLGVQFSESHYGCCVIVELESMKVEIIRILAGQLTEFAAMAVRPLF
nr:hypothetical protein [Tanacetum cinerariifolium]